MSDTAVRPPKPTLRPQNQTVAPFKIGDTVTVEPDTDDAMFVAGRTGTVTDVEHDTDDSWGPWVIRVLIPGAGTLAFKASELRSAS